MDDPDENLYALGAMIAVTLGLIEIVKLLVSKLVGANGKWTSTDRNRLESLFKWHAPTDEGTQEWKNPQVRTLLTEIRDSLHRLEKK